MIRLAFPLWSVLFSFFFGTFGELKYVIDYIISRPKT